MSQKITIVLSDDDAERLRDLAGGPRKLGQTISWLMDTVEAIDTKALDDPELAAAIVASMNARLIEQQARRTFEEATYLVRMTVEIMNSLQGKPWPHQAYWDELWAEVQQASGEDERKDGGSAEQ